MKRDFKPEEQTVLQLINKLTNDDDSRQDLWVYYLSGHNPSLFASCIQESVLKEYDYNRFQALVWDLSKAPLSDNLLKVLEGFSELEHSFVFLIMLGLDVPGISKYKGLSEVRVRQVITAIRNNTRWNEWLLNEASQIKKSTD